jgi:heme/copper-type cytochrome/quinol oxidase subunit 1
MKVFKKVLGAILGFFAFFAVMKIIEVLGMAMAGSFFDSEEAFRNAEALLLIGSLLIGVYVGALVYKAIAKTGQSNKSTVEAK